MKLGSTPVPAGPTLVSHVAMPTTGLDDILAWIEARLPDIREALADPEWLEDYALSRDDAEHPQRIPQTDMVAGLLVGSRTHTPSAIITGAYPPPGSVCRACRGYAWWTVDRREWRCSACCPPSGQPPVEAWSPP